MKNIGSKLFMFLLLICCGIVSIAQVIDVPKAGKYEYMEDSVPPIPIPPPIIVPDTLTDNAVTGTGGYQFAYTTDWTHSGDHENWYKTTMSYTLAGSVTYKFNGTKIWLYTEVGPTHGKIEISIDNVVVKTVDLYSPQFQQKVNVWSKDSLSQAVHTLKLRATGQKNPASTNAYLLVDFVGVKNPRPVPTDPIPPDPPTGIVIQPGTNTIKNAVESGGPNKTYSLIAGTYNESLIRVPLGVNIKGIKATSIINYNGATGGQTETGIFELKSDQRSNGNQTISGFTIKGNNKATAGIYHYNRDNVKILDIKVDNTIWFGIWSKNSTNVELGYLETFNASWCSVGWAQGEIAIGELTDWSLHHCYIKTTSAAEGYGIKALWGNTTLTRGKIYSNNIDVNPSSNWNNGSAPNIGLELHETYMGGIEIYDNFFVNNVSLASHKPTKSGRVIVRNNQFKMRGTSYAIELVLSNITVGPGNVFTETSIMTGNFGSNGKWVDQIIEGNTFTSNNANPSWGGTFLLGNDGANMIIRNNVINKGNYTLIKHQGNPANSQITLSNNTIDGVPQTREQEQDKDLIIIILIILVLVGVVYLIIRQHKK